MTRILLFLAIQFAALALVNASCLGDFIDKTEAQTARLEKKYSSFASEGSEIADINRPVILKGSKREAVFLVHGFMGSPEEMSGIAEKLNAEGYTTYTGLIPGYGANATVANEYTQEQWSRWYSQEVRRLEACYSKVHLIGFSTGALLATDYMTKNKRDEAIASVILVSPFYEMHSAFFSALRASTTVVLNQVPVDFLYYVLGYPDVGVMVKDRKSYLQAVPLLAGQNVIELGQVVQNRKITPTNVPALVFISGDDLVINQNTADKLTEKIFANRQVLARDGQDLKQRVPHHLMVSTVSPVARSTKNRIVEFLRSL